MFVCCVETGDIVVFLSRKMLKNGKGGDPPPCACDVCLVHYLSFLLYFFIWVLFSSWARRLTECPPTFFHSVPGLSEVH